MLLSRKDRSLDAFGLGRFFSGIRFTGEQAEQIKNLPEDAIVVYVNKYKSYLNICFITHATDERSFPSRKSALTTKYSLCSRWPEFFASASLICVIF